VIEPQGVVGFAVVGGGGKAGVGGEGLLEGGPHHRQEQTAGNS